MNNSSKDLNKRVFNHIVKDIGKIMACIILVVSVCSFVGGFIFGAIELVDVIQNDYLYLLIVDGIAVFLFTLGVSVFQYTDDTDPYLTRLWGKIVYPIVNMLILLGTTILFHWVLNLASNVCVEESTRGYVLFATLFLSIIFKIFWYGFFDPVNLFFYYVDDVIAKENGTYVEPKGRYDEVIKHLRNYENNYNKLERRE